MPLRRKRSKCGRHVCLEIDRAEMDSDADSAGRPADRSACAAWADHGRRRSGCSTASRPPADVQGWHVGWILIWLQSPWSPKTVHPGRDGLGLDRTATGPGQSKKVQTPPFTISPLQTPNSRYSSLQRSAIPAQSLPKQEFDPSVALGEKFAETLALQGAALQSG